MATDHHTFFVIFSMHLFTSNTSWLDLAIQIWTGAYTLVVLPDETALLNTMDPVLATSNSHFVIEASLSASGFVENC